MKKYIISLALLFVLCSGSLYVSYQMSMHRQAPAEPSRPEAEDQQKWQKADNANRLVVNNGMRYQLETYDSASGTKTTEILAVPQDMLGMTREEVVGYLNSKCESPSEEDVKQGLVNYELSSFSAKSMTVLKTITSTPAYQYYLVAEEGYLLVYLSDRTTDYLFTHIALTEFPEKEQSELMEGKGFYSMMDLFNYLESYTS